MFIIDGLPCGAPGLEVTSFAERAELALQHGDFRARVTRWVSSIVLHTSKGIPGGTDQRPQVVLPGFGTPVGAGSRTARCWADDGRAAGAHLVVDFDGAITQHADLLTVAAYHAGVVNDVSIGIEIYQGGNAELYSGQLDVVVRLVDYLTRKFSIQRQTPAGYLGAPAHRLETGALDFVGVFGHRDCSNTRGRGDPGDTIFGRLRAAGYEAWDIDAGQDLNAWKARQNLLRLPADGVPGPRTTAALLDTGHPAGMWVPRPGDSPPAVA